MHNAQFIHRDLKLANVMIKRMDNYVDDFEDDSEFSIVLIDLGHSCSLSDEVCLKQKIFSHEYHSQEYYQNYTFGKKIDDLYSIAVILLKLVKPSIFKNMPDHKRSRDYLKMTLKDARSDLFGNRLFRLMWKMLQLEETSDEDLLLEFITVLEEPSEIQESAANEGSKVRSNAYKAEETCKKRTFLSTVMENAKIFGGKLTNIPMKFAKLFVRQEGN